MGVGAGNHPQRKKLTPENSDLARGDGAWESWESELQADAHYKNLGLFGVSYIPPGSRVTPGETFLKGGKTPRAQERWLVRSSRRSRRRRRFGAGVGRGGSAGVGGGETGRGF